MAEQDTTETGIEGQGEGSASQSTAPADVTALLDSLDKESGSQSESGTETTDVPPEVMKALEGLDPAKLPQGLRDKLEHPFKADYTRKTQTLADERKKLESLTERIVQGLAAARPTQAVTEQEKANIKQLIDEGRMDEALAVVRSEVRAEVAPAISAVAQRNALDMAAKLEPNLPKYEQQVSQVLQANPELAKLAVVNNYEFAPRVLQGVVAVIERDQLRAELAKEKAGRAEFAKQAVLEYRRRVEGLPTTTSRAGTTAHGEKGAPEYTSLKDAMGEAARETGMFRE